MQKGKGYNNVFVLAQAVNIKYSKYLLKFFGIAILFLIS